MDFALSADQTAILEAVDALCARHAGPARAVELAAKQAYDAELEAALSDAGFLELARGPETGALEAALLVERVAAAAGSAAIGAAALVLPGVAGAAGAPPVALCLAAESGPVRFAPAARTLLVVDGDEARCTALSPDEVCPVRSNFGYLFGRVAPAARARGEALGAGSGRRALAWWRVALATEALGAMDAALRLTVAYLSQRQQFGRPIGSFQAVQHRLALCAVRVEGLRGLVYETAARGAEEEAAATLAGFAAGAAALVHGETHQLSGAIGYTREHDLHVYSMRLQALRLELGGASAHYRSLAALRWGAA